MSKKISFTIFFLLLIVLPLITILLPKKEFSDVENTSLEKFPKLSVETVFNRKFMSGLEKYISDHFMFRTNWISSKTKIELLSGKKDTNGVFVLKNRLVEKLGTPNYTEIDKSIAAINNFGNTNNLPVFFMLAPTATGIYEKDLPKNAPTYNQKAFIDSIYAQTIPKIINLDVYMPILSQNEKYIYYRNDHHWTSLGAYIAYSASIKKMGSNPIPIEKYDVEHASDTFKGTLYSKTVYNDINPDTLDLYYYNAGNTVKEVIVNTGKEELSYDNMYFKEYLDKKDKYSTYLGENQPIVTIKTNVEKKNKLLIFKDSYAHCYVPFLTQHYSEITMIDLRYVNTAYRNVVDIGEYNQVLFLYNALGFSTDENIKKLDFK